MLDQCTFKKHLNFKRNYTDLDFKTKFALSEVIAQDQNPNLKLCYDMHLAAQKDIAEFSQERDINRRRELHTEIRRKLLVISLNCKKMPWLIEDLNKQLNDAIKHILANPKKYFQNIPKSRWPVIIPRGGVPARR